MTISTYINVLYHLFYETAILNDDWNMNSIGILEAVKYIQTHETKNVELGKVYYYHLNLSCSNLGKSGE